MELKMGDIIKYQGEVWEVGFVNQISWKGTLRLQKSGHCEARQINRIRPDEVELCENPGSKNTTSIS